MTSDQTFPRRAFITPLTGRELLTPGQVFPREELLRRVLSLFWRNCCGVPQLARAPAPIMEVCRNATGARGVARLRAWWVLYDGIVEENEGPHAKRLALFFGSSDEAGQLWPRYEFELIDHPLSVEMSFHLDPGLSWNSHVSFATLPDGSVCVTRRGPRRHP